MQELTIKEVSEILGVSENTVLGSWNKCKNKALDLGITKEGRGKKAVYLQKLSENKNKLSFDILKEFLINECKFNTRTDFKKLIHYIYLVLLNTTDENNFYMNFGYTNKIGLTDKGLIHYRKKLTDSGIMKSKKISKGIYLYLDINGEYQKANLELYDTFNQCVINEAKRLLKANYFVDLTNHNDYKKAKEIIINDYDLEDLQEYINNLPVDKQKELIKDNLINITLKHDTSNDISKFYKKAYYEVSKAWQEELGIMNVKFYPKHILSDFITKDTDFIELIINAYNYIENN